MRRIAEKYVKCPICGQETSLFKSKNDKDERPRSCCSANISEAVKKEARRQKFDMPVFY